MPAALVQDVDALDEGVVRFILRPYARFGPVLVGIVADFDAQNLSVLFATRHLKEKECLKAVTCHCDDGSLS